MIHKQRWLWRYLAIFKSIESKEGKESKECIESNEG